MTGIINQGIFFAICVLTLLLLRKISGRYLPRRTMAVLWVILAVRMLIVVPIPININPINMSGFVNISTDEKTEKTETKETVINDNTKNIVSSDDNILAPEKTVNVTPAKETAENTYQIDTDLLKKGYIAVCIMMALAFAITYFIQHIKMRERLPLTEDEVFADISEIPLSKRKIKYYGMDGIGTAFSYGIFEPKIVLPMSFWQLTMAERSCILKHEIMHVSSWDFLKKIILECVLCIHWINPAAWVMFFEAGRDIEYSCDEKVLQATEEDIRAQYAQTIIHVLRLGREKLGLYNTFSYGNAKKRIITIMKTTKLTIKKRRCMNAVCVLAALAMAVTACSKRSTPAAEENITDTTTGEDYEANIWDGFTDCFTAENRLYVLTSMDEVDGLLADEELPEEIKNNLKTAESKFSEGQKLIFYTAFLAYESGNTSYDTDKKEVFVENYDENNDQISLTCSYRSVVRPAEYRNYYCIKLVEADTKISSSTDFVFKEKNLDKLSDSAWYSGDYVVASGCDSQYFTASEIERAEKLIERSASLYDFSVESIDYNDEYQQGKINSLLETEIPQTSLLYDDGSYRTIIIHSTQKYIGNDGSLPHNSEQTFDWILVKDCDGRWVIASFGDL